MENLQKAILARTAISEDELDLVCSLFEKKFLQKGEYLLESGKESKYMFFVNKGCIVFYTLADDKESVIEFETENTMFTDLFSYIQRVPSNCYMKALEETEIFRISRKNFDNIFDKSHAIERFVRKFLEEEYLKLIIRTTNINTLSAEERYLRLIRKRPQLLQRVPQYLIASYLGITPVGLSKIRKRLANK